MGADYDEKLYNKVIQASVLTEDIKQFSAGDLTEIGPNGVNLSGGQKARLALARALYLQADIYIFDDLLSAVDAHVERQIVEQVLAPGGIISDKARILVTHASHIVPLSNIAMAITDKSASGSICIDGIDISTLSVSDLRRHISVIPQDPDLFDGTLRENLDPGNEYTDEEIWEAIGKVKIEDLLETPTDKYTFDIDDDNEDSGIWLEGTGLNKWIKDDDVMFSAGQKQLVSLCRALLWKRKIVILDEATANIDTETDQRIQEVIRNEFKDCTVLTIAHRLDTVIDSDRILVMSDGVGVEFDTPQNLLANEDSHFAQLYRSMQLGQGSNE
ncbi:hypothetical protein FB645_005727 [Coemansia sp. IMI 203386]|nr:hypothetical protein FB645_005727 [Coemansia sp. IMI 203386]